MVSGNLYHFPQGDGQTRHAQSAESRIQCSTDISPDAGRSALECIYQGRPESDQSGEGAQPRPLWNGEGEGTHPGIYCGTQFTQRPEVPDYLSLRSSGSRKDIPWKEHCLSHETQICTYIPRRSARRSRDTRSSPHLYRRHARTYHQEYTEG